MAPKNKPNAFLFFMIEWKKKQEKRGIFYESIKEVQQNPECSAAWNALTPEQKAVYKQMEKSERENPTYIKGSKGGKKKLTGLGESVDEIDRENQRKQKFEDTMKSYISGTVKRGKRDGNLIDLKFYVIHVNHFYCRILDNNEADYHPAELSLVEFSIKDGITKKYHKLINERIYMGFRSDALTMSSESHHIPIEFEDAENNYETIYHDIINFLETSQVNGKYPPIFTCDEKMPPVQSLLQRVCRSFDRKDDFFLLYSFEYLFSCLLNEIELVPYQDIFAKMEIKKDPFAYKPGLDCDFHQEIQAGGLYCSQSIVTRWIYVLFSYCCEPLYVDMIEEKHKPINTEIRSIVGSLNASMTSLAISEASRRTGDVLSMTGVSRHHRMSVSERTHRDEILRRQGGKPLKIIDHGKGSATSSKAWKDDVSDRPLRLPLVKSAAPMLQELEQETQSQSDDQSELDLNSEFSYPSYSKAHKARSSGNVSINSTSNNGYAQAAKK